MKEFDEHGEPAKRKKRTLFNLFTRYEKDGKGVKKEAPITDFNFINFFKLYFRRFSKLVWTNALFILGNFPIAFLVFALSGYAGKVGAAPSSELFPILNGIRVAAGDLSPSLIPLEGIHGLMADLYIPTAFTYVLYGLSALFLFTFGPVNAGCAYIIKNLLIGEPVFLWEDFKSTIKQNWKQALPLGILDLIVLGLSFYALYMYYFNYANYYVMFYMTLFVIMLYTFMRFYLYTMLVTFDLSLPKLYKNAAIFSLLGFGRNFILFLGIVMFAFLSFALAMVFLPLGVISIFFLLFSTTSFMGAYASYPKIKKYMIDPYYAKNPPSESSDEI